MSDRPRRHSRRPHPAVLPGIAGLAAAVLAAAPAAGQVAAPPAAPAVPAEPGAPEEPMEFGGLPVAGPIRSDDLAPAQQALDRMVAAYRAAPALIDDIEIHVFMADRQQPVERGRVMFEGDGYFAVEGPGSLAVAADERVRIRLDRFRTRYVDVPLDRNMFHTVRQGLRTQVGLAWHLRSRYSDEPGQVMHALSLGVPEPTRIHGHEEATLPDGRVVDRVTLWSEVGWSVVTLDRESGLMLGLDVEYRPPGAPIENFRITQHLRANPRVVESLPERIAFDSQDRRAVTTMAELYGRATGGQPVPLAVEVGQPVELPEAVTLEGVPWSLEEKAGRVQVLVAWNMGSTAFKRARPPLVALRERLKRMGGAVPIDLYLLNTRDDTPAEEKWDTVYDYWFDRDYDIPCLFDETNEFAASIGLTQVPATIVIDARGRLVGTHGGLDASWPTEVDALIRKALEASAAGSPGE